MMNTTVTIAMLGAAMLMGPDVPSARTGDHLPVPFAQGDPADSLWRAGRRAITDEEWDRAVEIFARVRTRFARSAYVGDSYFWQAWALYQKGSTAAYRQAVDLLATQRDVHPDAGTVRSGEAARLGTRIRGLLAQSGDEAAAAEIARRAESAAVAGAGGGAGGGASAARSQTRTACPREEDDDRVMALNALLQMRSDDALPLLKQVLARRDACSEVLRRKAVFLVSQKGRSAEAADILMDAAQNDPDAETREQAVFWLSQVNTERATALLEQILKTSKDEVLQDKAIFALSQGRDVRRSEILRDYAARDDVPDRLREQAVFWLGQRRSPETAQFLRGLFARARSDDLKEKILFSISQQNIEGNDQFLIDQVNNAQNSMQVRKQALFWAGQSGAVNVAALAALYDKTTDVEMREQVIFVLSQRSRDTAALDKLIDIARAERNRDLREKAIFWLGQSRDPKALRALSEIVLRPPQE